MMMMIPRKGFEPFFTRSEKPVSLPQDPRGVVLHGISENRTQRN
jgi:hypothetical protein